MEAFPNALLHRLAQTVPACVSAMTELSQRLYEIASQSRQEQQNMIDARQNPDPGRVAHPFRVFFCEAWRFCLLGG